MNRREFLGTALAPGLASGAAAPPPNIVFLLADDLGYGDLGCYGQKRIRTPNIDGLALSGARFTQAYSGATVCAPSRCSLMTGKHGGHATVRGNARPEVGLRADEATLPGVLKRAGYRTAIFGKWGLGGPGTRSTPNQRGFDEFFGYLDQLHAHNCYPEHLWQDQNEFFLTANWFNRRKQYAPDLITDRALEFLGREHHQPFFLYLAYTLPHANNELGAMTGNGMEVPADAAYGSENWPEPEKGFARMVSRLDGYVGRVLEALKNAGRDQNTLVVFTSDNGPHREGGHSPDFFQSRGPLRGIKRDLYEGGIRVPFLARWPGRVRESAVSNEVLAFWDLLPTFAEVASAPAPASLDGASVLAALLGKPQKPHRPLYWEFHEGGFSQAVRMGDWKGVRPKLNAPVELYNLARDIGEREDVAARHPDIVERMAALMKSAHVESPEFPVGRKRETKPFEG